MADTPPDHHALSIPSLTTHRRGALTLSAAAATALATRRAAAQTPAQTTAQTPTAAALATPLGIGLESWPYPGPVQFLPLTLHSQPVRMAYMDFAPTAPANGRTIFLLHGKNFDGSYWSGPITWLRAAGFRVIAPDQIGFNKSSKPDLAYSFELLAANTLALADALHLAKFTVLGHSTGGMLAVRLTSIAPDRIEQLILEDPIGLIDYRAHIPPQATETLEATERNYTVRTYRAFIAHYFPILPPAEYEPFVTWRMRVALSGEYDRFVRATALTYQMIYRGPVLDLYPTLTPPTLLLAGELDQSTPLAAYAPPDQRARIPTIPQAARAIVSTIPHGKLVTFPKLGHVPHLEAPAEFQRVMLGFLK